jgi:pimeloyl-ACP methyl ester carboxylesterase
MKKLLTLITGLILALPVVAEQVQISHQDLTLNANLVKVDGNWPAGPVVLMTHGTLAHGNMEIMAGLQSMFEEMEISTLSISLSLGLSDRKGMYDCQTPHSHLHTDAVTEIGLWHDWLKKQGVENIVLLGHSRGGNQTARYATSSNDKTVSRVYLLAPQVLTNDYSHQNYEKRYKKPLAPLLEKAQKMVSDGQGKSLMKDIDFIYCEKTQVTAEAFISYYYQPEEKMDTTNLLSAINYPVTVFAGSQDNTVKNLIPKTQSKVDGEKSKLVIIDGADHFFRDLYSEEVVEAIIEDFEGS